MEIMNAVEAWDYLQDNPGKSVTKIADKGTFTPSVYETEWGVYRISEIYRCSDDVIRECLLVYPYRAKSELIKPSELFLGLEDGPAKDDLRVMDIAITEYPEYETMNDYINGKDEKGDSDEQNVLYAS